MKNRHLFLVLVLLLLLAAILVGIRILWPMVGEKAEPTASAAVTQEPEPSLSPTAAAVTPEAHMPFESHEEEDVPELELGDDTVIVLDETQGVGGF